VGQELGILVDVKPNHVERAHIPDVLEATVSGDGGARSACYKGGMPRGGDDGDARQPAFLRRARGPLPLV
jgi:hypothetical protein